MGTAKRLFSLPIAGPTHSLRADQPPPSCSRHHRCEACVFLSGRDAVKTCCCWVTAVLVLFAQSARAQPAGAPKKKPASSEAGKAVDAGTKKGETAGTKKPSCTCGTERWSVKTGKDPDAHSVDLTAKVTTIASLTALSPPTQKPDDLENIRVRPTELSTFKLVNVTLTDYKEEADCDYHLALKDGNVTMIAEIPGPNCAQRGVFATAIGAARKALEKRFTPSTEGYLQPPAATVITVEGVGFFDVHHLEKPDAGHKKVEEQRGAAANQIELHPVLKICVGKNCAL